MFSSEQDHCSGGKRKHSGELHCSRNNQDQVCRGDPLSFNGFIIFELWTEMEDNLIFSKALTDNEDIADKALENLPLGRWVIFSRCTLALVQAESYLKVCKILGWPTTYSIFNSDWLHIAIHHVSSLQPLKIDHVSQIWPAWRDGGHRELFGVGRGLILFSNWILILFRLNIKSISKVLPRIRPPTWLGKTSFLQAEWTRGCDSL